MVSSLEVLLGRLYEERTDRLHPSEHSSSCPLLHRTAFCCETRQEAQAAHLLAVGSDICIARELLGLTYAPTTTIYMHLLRVGGSASWMDSLTERRHRAAAYAGRYKSAAVS
jgi:hypothetical protein